MCHCVRDVDGQKLGGEPETERLGIGACREVLHADEGFSATADDQLSRPGAANPDEEVQVDRAVGLKRLLTTREALFRDLPDIDSLQQPSKVIPAGSGDAVHDLIDSRAVQIQDIVVP